MTIRWLSLVVVLAAGCVEAPDAPPQSGTANDAVTTAAEAPASAMAGGDVADAEPGLPGTAVPTATYDLGSAGRCYLYDRVAVRVRARLDVPGEDVTVLPASGTPTRALCDAEGPTVSTAGEPDAFAGVQGDRLLLDRGTGPTGRVLRVLDLTRGGAVVFEGPYEEPVQVRGSTLRLGRLQTRADDAAALAASGAACPQAAAFFDDGLRVGVVRAVDLDLRSGQATETDSTYCAPLQ